MKISKEQLKQIVREELASITENRNKFFIVDPMVCGNLLITEDWQQTMILNLSFLHYLEQLDLMTKEVQTPQ